MSKTFQNSCDFIDVGWLRAPYTEFSPNLCKENKPSELGPILQSAECLQFLLTSLGFIDFWSDLLCNRGQGISSNTSCTNKWELRILSNPPWGLSNLQNQAPILNIVF
ncbi:hypothetical protein KIL84_010218 [Mauremys mutica]|uniref:Uncharacterized protein n=1 Tax=Mauremys mutica TaxID=74926 RepID=A0A9D3XKV6_9SAUR|nr:hypothetical protein KIL84_010218 [Mauremys mutica]